MISQKATQLSKNYRFNDTTFVLYSVSCLKNVTLPVYSHGSPQTVDLMFNLRWLVGISVFSKPLNLKHQKNNIKIFLNKYFTHF